MGTQVPANGQNGFTRRTKALAAAVVLVVPILTSAVVQVMVERGHEEMLRSRCRVTPAVTSQIAPRADGLEGSGGRPALPSH